MNTDNMDPRLRLAFDLITSALAQSNAPPTRANGAAAAAFAPPPPIPHGRMSATDLLSWWFRPATSSTDPWDEFFDHSAQTIAAPVVTAPTLMAPAISDLMPEIAVREPFITHQPQVVDENQLIPPQQTLSPWVNLQDLVVEPEEELAEGQAEAAVECLYDFIHAIGRREVETALQCVADDYHVFMQDREYDCLALRHELESLLDSLRGWDFDITLAQIPTPIFHQNGILFYLEIQIDARQFASELRRSMVHKRVAVCEQNHEQKWLISALSEI